MNGKTSKFARRALNTGSIQETLNKYIIDNGTVVGAKVSVDGTKYKIVDSLHHRSSVRINKYKQALEVLKATAGQASVIKEPKISQGIPVEPADAS